MEKFIIDMLILNAFNYKKFESDYYKAEYCKWLERLRVLNGFENLEQTAEYLIAYGESQNTRIA